MLQKLTKVKVADNTGVIDAMVIQVYSGRKVYAKLGDFVRLSTKTIKRLRRTKKVSANRMRKIVFRKKRRMSTIIRMRRAVQYLDGATLRFKTNAVILYKKRKMFKGKRFQGITTRGVGFEKVMRKFIFYI